jgi:sortase (surface protein transpeptidase)
LDNCVTQLPNAPTDPATIRFAGVSMKIHRLGLDPKNDIDLTALDNAPADAGWYCYSPAPGLKGPSVLLGHVDWNGGKPAAFAKLKTLKAGNEITVTTTGGTTLIFQVTKVEQVKKISFPADEVYGDTLDSQLRLITCGGVFDHKAKSYVDNTIVFLTKRAKAG